MGCTVRSVGSQPSPPFPSISDASSPRGALALRRPRQHAQDGELRADGLAAASGRGDQRVVVRVVQRREHLGGWGRGRDGTEGVVGRMESGVVRLVQHGEYLGLTVGWDGRRYIVTSGGWRIRF